MQQKHQKMGSIGTNIFFWKVLSTDISTRLLPLADRTTFDSQKSKTKDRALEVYQMNYLQPVNNVERDMNLLDLQSRVEHALLQLPERRRQVFELSRIQGLSHKEISQELGISPKTVENHLTLAIQDFKTAFGDNQIVQNLAFLFADWI